MNRLCITLFLGVVLLFCSRGVADVAADIQAASAALEPAMKEAVPDLAEGKLDQVNQRILATFPEKSRTAVQALILGNVLFKQDPASSYALHKRAAAELPDEPLAQLEWALEQHRAGEFAGALATYAKFSKAQPEFGPVWGMAAECLIRTGKTREAVEAWLKSEQGRGSIEQFESWVCDVHTHSSPDRECAGYIAKVKLGDIDAAEKLVALDCDFPVDWWNAGPDATDLQKDLDILKAATFADQDRLRAILCAARCGLIEATDEGNAADVLRQAGYLIDEKATLPPSGKLLSPMLSAAIASHVLSDQTAREKLGPSILEKARASRDAAMFNAAAHLYVGTDRLPAIDQEGWDATADQRFAASLLVGLMRSGSLKADDPRLTKAAKQFPDNAEISRIRVALGGADKADPALLVEAIKAEYTHFSVGGLLAARPSAGMLRAYFALLAKAMAIQPATKPG